MKFNITWDASVGSAPAAFKPTVTAVTQFFESTFSDPVTVNITVGYGEVGGTAMGSGALGESLTYFNGYSYAQIKNALGADAKTGDDASSVASLWPSDPTPGGSGHYWVATAEAKALGLLLGSSSGIDGSVGFSSTANFDYDNSNGVTAGAYDFYGTVAHEISEVMGRQLLVGGRLGGTSNSYEPLDLFHYSAPGVRDFSGTTPGYFSVDGGTTSLAAFNTSPGGDYGDWAASAGSDAGLAFSSSGVVNVFSEADLKAMDVLGWDRAVMRVVYFYATESKTGDSYYGYTYDNANKYSNGQSWTSSTVDQAGGHWSFLVYGVATADSAHQNAAYNGYSYDTYYLDADTGQSYATLYGSNGYALSAGGIGSDYDYVYQNGGYQLIGSSYYVLPELPVMKVITFTATESTTGDKITGYMYDNSGAYGIGSTVTTSAPGVQWTYTVTGVAKADSLHQDTSFAGKVYDTVYYDADLGTSFTTAKGYPGAISGSWAGYYASVGDSADAQWWLPWEKSYVSGSNGLGSDADSVTINGKAYGFGKVAGSELAVPELPVMKVVTFTATESNTGDKITGYMYDTGTHHVGDTHPFGPDQLGGTWTYAITKVAMADGIHQDASFAGKVYDTVYYDADLGTSFTTTTGYLGAISGSWAGYYASVGDSAGVQWWLPWEKAYASGTGGLGSDADSITVNGTAYGFGKVGGSERVVPEKIATQVAGDAAAALTASGTDSASSAGTAAVPHASTSADEALTGGAGADAFQFAKLFGHDTVAQFTPGEDVIEFQSGLFASLDDLLAHHAAQVGSDVVISDAAGDTLTIKGVSLDKLHATDFHLV